MAFLDFQIELSWKNMGKWLFLKGLSLVYRCLVSIWLTAYHLRLKNGWTAQVSVISVGNITVGGTGKTPLIDWLLSFMSEKELKPAVLTRGYMAKRTEKIQLLNRETAGAGDSDRFGDEPLLLFHHHPHIPIYISPDRVASAKQAQMDADILLLDDGMQHLRLNRDLDILLIDTVSGIGNGQIIPLGPLREPLDSLSRADIIIYTKSNLVASQAIREKIHRHLRKGTRQFDSQFLPDQLFSSSNPSPLSPACLENRKCLLVSGIGNPDSFTKTIQVTGAIVQDHLIFSDHQVYDLETIDRINRFAEKQPYDYLICTEKDWVKLEPQKNELPEMFRLKMKMHLDLEFIHFLNNWLRQKGDL